jgi:hypothetical protein
MLSTLATMVAANQVVLEKGTGNVTQISGYTGTYPGGAAALRTRGVEAVITALITLMLAAFIMHR